MSKIVDLTQKIKQQEEEKLVDSYYENHNYVLDTIEEVFPLGGILLEITEDNGVNMSSTDFGDMQIILDALVSAALKVNEEMEKEQ